MNTNQEFELLKEPNTVGHALYERLQDSKTSAGYALAKHLPSGKICVVKDNEIVHITEYDDIWIEYPKDTYFERLHWHSPDLLNFFKDGYWGTMQPDGTVVIPNEYETVLNYKQSGYIILRNKDGKVGCARLVESGDTDDSKYSEHLHNSHSSHTTLQLLIPFVDSWIYIRQTIDYWIDYNYDLILARHLK